MTQSTRESDKEPNEWGIVRKLGMPTLVIRFDITRVETEEGVKYTFKEIIGNPGRATYEEFVSAMINFKYPYDKVEAIRNNYLMSGQASERYRQEFEDFQAFRCLAKDTVARIIEETSHYFNTEEPENPTQNE